MTSIPDWQQVQEGEYFNWRCIICHDLAKSPLHLEQQFLERHGIYLDINNCEWVKCHKCFNPHYLQNEPDDGDYETNNSAMDSDVSFVLVYMYTMICYIMCRM